MELLLDLKPAPDRSLQIQIFEQIRRLILEGALRRFMASDILAEGGDLPMRRRPAFTSAEK